MLSREKLVELYRELQQEKVLSIYLDGEGRDPGKRDLWRKELEKEVEHARTRLDSDEDAFQESLSRLMELVDDFEAFVPDEGWVGFATPDQVWYSESVPVPMPTLVRWEEGIRVAPYVRGLKQSRLVVTVLLDSRRARIFRYHDGELFEPEALRADTFMGDLSDVNVSKRASNATGTRGETGTDAAQRYLEVSSERMLNQLMETVSGMLGNEGYLILGGTPEMVSKAAGQVPKSLAERVAQRPSMHVEMSHAEVRDAVERTASEISRKQQAALVDEVVNQAHANGKACLGPEATQRALQERRVDTLLLARSFVEGDPDLADHCAGTAFEQQAAVEEISGDADQRLMSEGQGIGARLRYTVPDENAAEG